MGEHKSTVASRRADIQGLRAVAVLLVVAYHAELPVPGGYVGVDMFFVISGFVIGSMLLRQATAGRKVRFRDFYTRRMRRLLPALAVATVLVAFASTLLLSPLGPQQATARTGIAASLFSANLQLSQVSGGGYFDLSAEANALLHTWSLSVEEQFYLVFPALLLGTWAVGRKLRPRWSPRVSTAIAVTGGIAVSFSLALALTYRPSSRLGSSFAFYSSATRAWEFGLGVLLAAVAGRIARLGPRTHLGAGLVGVALIAYCSLAFTDSTVFPGWAAVIPVTGTALLIVAGTGSRGVVPAVLSIRSLVWVGDVSYGWYLWHWPLIVFAVALWPGNQALAVAVAFGALVPTYLSYRFIENPIRFNDRIVGRSIVVLVLACIIVPIASFTALLAINRAERRTPSVVEHEEATRLHLDRASGCDTSDPVATLADEQCTWSSSSQGPRRGPVVLLGDSNAGQFTEAVVSAGNRLGRDVTVATSAGCPFADLIREPDDPGGFDGERCRAGVLAVLDDLAVDPPSLVFIAMSTTEYLNGSTETLVDPITRQRATSTADKAVLWEEALRRTLVSLDAAGIPTVVVQTIPQLGAGLGNDWSATQCPAIRIFTDTCGGSVASTTADAERAAGVSAQVGAASELNLASTEDLFALVCPGEDCKTHRDGKLFYRDATHLSVEGAQQLTPRFDQLIKALALTR